MEAIARGAANRSDSARMTANWAVWPVYLPRELSRMVALTRSKEASSSRVKFAADTGYDVFFICTSGAGCIMAGRAKNGQAGMRFDPLGNRGRRLFAPWRTACWLVVAGLLVGNAGCERAFYRKNADKEVAEVLADKDRYPDWKIENWHIYPDPRARFADPSDPDHPPKPPDDPASYDLSPNPQKPGKAGVARTEGTGYLELIAKWDKDNRERQAKRDAEENLKLQGDLPEPAAIPSLGALEADEDKDPGTVKWVSINGQKSSAAKADAPPKNAEEPPELGITLRDAIVEAKTPSSLDIKGRPAFLLTLDQAAELGMFNSREYQDQRENLYLAALPVTLERFSFTSQFFAAGEALRDYSGRDAVGGPANNWSANSGTGLSKVLPTGALLLLNFSNQTVFDFLNPKSTISTTSLNFSAVQPLLRGGGEAVALETLTQAERNLVYQIRTYARFRKQLYVEIASTNGGSINGSSFQPSGVLSNGGGSSGGLSGFRFSHPVLRVQST
jgi:hypothetical protein